MQVTNNETHIINPVAFLFTVPLCHIKNRKNVKYDCREKMSVDKLNRRTNVGTSIGQVQTGGEGRKRKAKLA